MANKVFPEAKNFISESPWTVNIGKGQASIRVDIVPKPGFRVNPDGTLSTGFISPDGTILYEAPVPVKNVLRDGAYWAKLEFDGPVLETIVIIAQKSGTGILTILHEETVPGEKNPMIMKEVLAMRGGKQ
jgi:hypothetical protein